MTNHEKIISTQLDQARQMEDHYRALLLFWKGHRQSLEAQIYLNSVFDQMLQVAAPAWRNDDRPN